MATCVCPFPRTDCPRCEFACEVCVDAFNASPGRLAKRDGEMARLRAALEVARGALVDIAAGVRYPHSLRIASRALTAIGAVTGGGAADATDDGIDLGRCGGCGDPCVVWREDRPLGPNDPCAWIREPGIWVFDCKNQDPRDEVVASPSTSTGGTPGAGEALSDGDGCQACVDGVDHVSCEPYFVPAPSIPVAQRRPAREAKLLEMGQACLDWAKDTGGCHFCCFDALHLPHDEDCPVREYYDLPFEADRRGEP